HPEAVAITGRYLYRDSFRWAKLEYSGRNLINKLTAFLSGNPLLVSGATFAFRRQAFLSVNGYRGLTYSADQHGIASRLSRVGKVLYDQGLYVLTSSRSVQKSNLALISAVAANAGHWVMYLCRNWLKALPARTLSRRALARLLPVPTIIVALIVYGYFIPASPVFGQVFYKGGTAEKVVALTFDDGPNEPYTSEILDILASYNIKATFFLIGQNVELYPQTARLIAAEGNVIGNHSYSHLANHALTEYGARDLIKAQQVIFNVTGVTPHLYCPPHGKKSPWEMYAAKEAGLIEVTWSVSANDQHILAFWGEPSPEAFAREIASRSKPGGIILLHDGYGTSHGTAKSDTSLTVKALPLIIEQLQAEGYSFVTVPELLNVPEYIGGLP
ncbi:MAG: polysaccharide deacetylase family protein, partial [Chloroflexota bacterium]